MVAYRYEPLRTEHLLSQLVVLCMEVNSGHDQILGQIKFVFGAHVKL